MAAIGITVASKRMENLKIENRKSVFSAGFAPLEAYAQKLTRTFASRFNRRTARIQSLGWRKSDMKQQRLLTGFTLIESIVALAVVVTAMTGPFALASRSIFAAKFSKSKIITLHLAQEGVEIIRAFRENNLHAGQAWDAGLAGGTYRVDLECLASLCTPAQAPQFQPCSGVCPVLLFDGSTGIYSYTSGDPAPYTRTVTIDRGIADQMRITATVTWTESGIARSVSVSEVFYNWL